MGGGRNYSEYLNPRFETVTTLEAFPHLDNFVAYDSALGSPPSLLMLIRLICKLMRREKLRLSIYRGAKCRESKTPVLPSYKNLPTR